MHFSRFLVLFAALLALSCQSAPPPPPPPPPPEPVVVAPPPPPPDPTTFTATVGFDAESAALSASGRSELSGFAAKLEPYPERRVVVQGHAETTPAEQKDPWLAERRAKAVASYLVSQGIAPDHITLKGVQPDTAADGSRNVEVSVR